MNYSGYLTDNEGNKYFPENNTITALLSSDLELTAGTTSTRLVLDESTKIGSKLSLTNDGKVLIGEGISKVLVSGQVRITNNNETDLSAYNIYIYKNGSIVVSGRGVVEAGKTDGLFQVPFLVEVGEGDLISMGVWKSSSHLATLLSNYNSTFLTVEAV